ncbi:MAG: DUF3052 family protein [Vicinamibacterales bacterium]
MGLSRSCAMRKGRRVIDGTAHLEPTDISFRAATSKPGEPPTMRTPLSAIRSADAKGGTLTIVTAEGTWALELGRDAEAWALKIRYPKSRLDKLGVKPESVVSIVGVDDSSFLDEVRARTTAVTTGRLAKGVTLAFLGVRAVGDLDRLATAKRSIVSNGAVWVVWPKGRKELREGDVRDAARAAGLVDVKVASFSDTLSSLKLVIPVADR